MPQPFLSRASYRVSALVLAAFLGICSVSSAFATASDGAPKKDTGAFLKLHQSFLDRGKAGPIGLLFLGDSITARWNTLPDLWKEDFGAYQPANFGISGDKTQNVIWRIENGELDGIHPKVVVLMIGTNNSSTDSAADIAAADQKIVRLIREKIPETKVLLLAIFPRGATKGKDGTVDPGTERMVRIRAANAELAKLDNGDTVRYLDIGAKFLGPDGSIPDSVMKDHLHPTPEGLKIWGDAIKPVLAEMMGTAGKPAGA